MSERARAEAPDALGLVARRIAAVAALAWAAGLASFGLFAPGAAAELRDPTVAGVRAALVWVAGGGVTALVLVGAIVRRAPRMLDAPAAWSTAAAMALAPWAWHGSLFFADELHGQLAVLAVGACTAHAAASLRALDGIELSRAAGFAIVLAAATALAAWSAHEGIGLHLRFETRAFDLANYEQAFWNTLHGRFLASSYFDGGTLLGHHFSPGLLLPIAAYALVPRAETLIVFQAASVALAAVPLYGFVLRRSEDPLLAASLALAYLLAPATELPLFYDYHDVSLLPLGVFTTLWALESRRFRLALVAAVATASAKEEGALVAAGILAWGAVEGRAPRGAALAAAVGLVGWFVAAKALLMPALSGRGVAHLHYYADLSPVGGRGLGDLVLALLANPIGALREALTPPKLLHFARLTFPLLLLPFARVRSLVLLAVPFAIVFLSSRRALYDFVFQYNFYLVPPLFGAAAIALTTRRERRHALSAAAVVLLLVCLENRHHGPLLRGSPTPIRLGAFLRPPTEEERARYARVSAVLDRVPSSVSVAAAETLGPHLARREHLYRVHRSPADVDVLVVWTDRFDELERARSAEELADYEVVHRSRDLTIICRRALEASAWFFRRRPRGDDRSAFPGAQ